MVPFRLRVIGTPTSFLYDVMYANQHSVKFGIVWPMSYLRSLFFPAGRIDYRIEDTIGARPKKSLIVHSVDLPAYRFVDLFNAIEESLSSRQNVQKIETQQSEQLNHLIHDSPEQWADRSIRRSTKTAWPIGPHEEVFLPTDCFWLCPSEDVAECYVIRLSFAEYPQKAKLELACGDTDAGKGALQALVELSRKNSVYRNRVLQLSYEAGKRDEYGDIEKQEQFHILFSRLEPIGRKDIVLNERHHQVLQRNIVDLYARRDILEANGVPARRGVLLHGPPGTGKTFACRYLCHELTDVTKIFISGSSLLNVSSIFSFARLLQPSVLFLEDVDLIFATREINLHSSALGDLLDQLDGLRSHENISVVLTTNAINRLEAAIKDRPGRISQCVYMGAPDKKQRELFIRHLLEPYNVSDVDISVLVAESDGATQAFLKEWVRRSVQISCERLDSAKQRAVLRDSDFMLALDEMRSFLEGSEGQLLGFVSVK